MPSLTRTPVRRLLFEGYQAPPVTGAWTGWQRRPLVLSRAAAGVWEREWRQTNAFRRAWHTPGVYPKPALLREAIVMACDHFRQIPEARAWLLGPIPRPLPLRPPVDVWLEANEWPLADFVGAEARRLRRAAGWPGGFDLADLVACGLRYTHAFLQQWRAAHGLAWVNEVP